MVDNDNDDEADFFNYPNSQVFAFEVHLNLSRRLKLSFITFTCTYHFQHCLQHGFDTTHFKYASKCCSHKKYIINLVLNMQMSIFLYNL